MTFSSPILASAFVLASAALLALRHAVSSAAKQSTVKVRGNRRRPANTKTQG